MERTRVARRRRRPVGPSPLIGCGLQLALGVVALVALYVWVAFGWYVRWEYARWRIQRASPGAQATYREMWELRNAVYEFARKHGTRTPDLASLRAESLIDAELATGRKHGYRFRLAFAKAIECMPDDEWWGRDFDGCIVTAEPETERDSLHFAFRTGMAVRFDARPVGDLATGRIRSDALYEGKPGR